MLKDALVISLIIVLIIYFFSNNAELFENLHDDFYDECKKVTHETGFCFVAQNVA